MARIAFLIPTLGGGGAERVALSLMGYFVARGHSVDLLIMRDGGELLALLPPEVRVIAFQTPRLRHVLWPLLRYLRAEKPDSIQAFMWPLTSIAVIARMLSRSQARLMLSDHTMMSMHFAAYGAVRKFILRHSIRWLYPRADSRVIVSPLAADDVAKLSGLQRDSLTVINNPIEAPPPGCATTPAIEQLWSGRGMRIITVGSLKREKNHFVLLSAFALLRQSHDVRLMIVGEGDLHAALEAHARSLGVAEHVAMAGFTLNPHPYYVSADLFVLSSDNEGYPLVLVEAMFAGLRIVSTDCPSGPREILADGRFGRLVPAPPARALAEAMAASLDAPHDPSSSGSGRAAVAAQLCRLRATDARPFERRAATAKIGAQSTVVLTPIPGSAAITLGAGHGAALLNLSKLDSNVRSTSK
jgi:glycosyltransferase involved in cell wall biosynthesis